MDERYDKAFFIRRNLIGDDPYGSKHKLKLDPRPPFALAYRTFRQGQGADFRDFLRQPLKSGERQPRQLPNAVATEVARQVNEYRRGHQEDDIAFNVCLIVKGDEQMTWSLERKVSRQAVRYDPVKLKLPAATIVARELDTMQIARWYRDLHYCIYVTAFPNEHAVASWEALNPPPASMINDNELPASTRAAPTTRPIGRQHLGVSAGKTLWFERDGWQALPEEFVNKMTPDAKKLVFPGRSWPRAVKRASGGLVLSLFVTGFYELSKQDPSGRPANCVWTRYRGYVSVDFAEATVRVAA